jgi:hypothetical protein
LAIYEFNIGRQYNRARTECHAIANLTKEAREMGTNTVAITEGRVSTNGIFFVEPLKFEDNELRIEYTGKVFGDVIKLHRKVGDFVEEDLVIKWVKEAKVETKAGTNSPPAFPH